MHTSVSIINLFAVLLMSCSPMAAVQKNNPELTADGTATSSEATPIPVTESVSEDAVLLFGIGMHIEPQGETAQGYKSGKGDYANPAYFARHVQDILTVADIVEKHGGAMTIQAQSPFTEVAVLEKNPILYNLAAAGHEMALHFHEDAHLGKKSQDLSPQAWCDVMKEEIALVELASASPQGEDISAIRYWSGGNLYPQLFEAASCAGLSINSDWKNPQTQTTDPTLMGINPWRPSGGTDGTDFSQLTVHDPSGEVVFLPEGKVKRDKPKSAIKSPGLSDDEAYFEYLEQALMNSLTEIESGKVNVFHFTVHPGEYRGSADHPFEVIDRFLTEVVDPLVASGKIQWATFGEMSDAYTAWESAHPGQDMRK
ncbi:MAG: hypothetical protein AB9891_20810 [Anaerolineaceae bacterium]